MKRSLRRFALWFLPICFGLLSFACSQHPTHAYFEWYIPAFDVAIDVASDSSLVVTEKITADFDVPKHGIYRDIPLEYQNDIGLNYNLRLKVLDVTDENNTGRPFTVSRDSGNMHIRIGDPDVTVTGVQKYVIRYSVERGIRFFDDFDELYWNVTGDLWDVPISSASLTVTYPQTDPAKINTRCFTGYRYSRTQRCEHELYDTHAIFTAKTLDSYSGLTAVLGLPKGLLTPPSSLQTFLWYLFDNAGLLLPLVVFAILFYLWWTRGRDPKKYETIVVEFSAPDNLTPAEMGTLIDESADIKDISAEIIHLAVTGHLIIEEKKTKRWIFSSTDFVLSKRKTGSAKTPLSPHQKELFDALFGTKDTVKISELRNKFYKSIPDIQSALYKEVVGSKKYFPANPHRIRMWYFVTGIIVLVGSFFSFSFFAVIGRLDLLFGILMVGPIFLFMAKFMPRKTLLGAETYRKVLGFKDYIRTAERYRVKFQEDQNIFERFLPYAMIFGLADKWASAFKDIYKGKPNWYRSSHPFDAFAFTHTMQAFAKSANSTLSSRPSSKGSSSSSGFSGGFSGGGFGGGGGGSW